ncbi:MAG: PIN domain-containing protein [Oscillospiraceae bacterium]|nr:PIN domain-containing protein [Oscillospiraceae bacterium]
MKNTLRIFDANVILRYILKDNDEMFARAAKLIYNGNILILNEVIAEVVFVLSGRLYNIERKIIAETIICFLDEIEYQDDVLRKGIETYAYTKLDFVDCILCAHHIINNSEICTFDKELTKQLNRKECFI